MAKLRLFRPRLAVIASRDPRPRRPRMERRLVKK